MEITINLKYKFSAYATNNIDQTTLTGETEHSFDTDIDINDGVELYRAIQKEVANLSNEYLDFNFVSRGGIENYQYCDTNDNIVYGFVGFNRDRVNSKTVEIRNRIWMDNKYRDFAIDKTYTLETKDYTVIKITDNLKETA